MKKKQYKQLKKSLEASNPTKPKAPIYKYDYTFKIIRAGEDVFAIRAFISEEKNRQILKKILKELSL